MSISLNIGPRGRGPAPCAFGALGQRHGLSSWSLLRGPDHLVLSYADTAFEEALTTLTTEPRAETSTAGAA